ncbi:MAG: precorrin-2 C(20)-methyltransferase [Deltaproteobacteria bacterium]|nr:MAG: precorrin-2 C(20)-methyltransferase [Desulfobacterales bacterium]PIE73809.1 MAG: precorrin-2 C(20)-methyltransferase [Deltaproteobacteria bacterium]
MQGTFYIVGVGPGDPQLLTLKGARILQETDIWFVPSAYRKGGSRALEIASGAVETAGKKILSHHFPMKRVQRGQAPDAEIQQAWRKAASIVVRCLDEGEDVAFPTLGDPAIYSTGFYVIETLQAYGSSFHFEIVPGISSMGAVSASSGLPLCLGDERFVVIPAAFEDEKIRLLLDCGEAFVFMKVHKALERIIGILDELDLVDNAVLIERASFADERVWTNIREAVGEELHYFSSLIVRK